MTDRADVRPIVCPPFLFLPHPDTVGHWIRTDVCVALRDCPACHAPRGALCKNGPGDKRGAASTHISRRRIGRALKAALMLALAKDRDYRFPGAAWYVAREFEQNGFRTGP